MICNIEFTTHSEKRKKTFKRSFLITLKHLVTNEFQLFVTEQGVQP